MKDLINYPKVVDEAMRSVVPSILSIIEKNGPLGEHHFYISFDTNMFGVEISDNIKSDYPEEMTIVLQHQFENLTVEKSRFSVTLFFKGKAEKLVIPFKAITAFSDPSVKFTIEFTSHDPIHMEEEAHDKKEKTPIEEDHNSTNVITLDKFRDKNKK